MKKHAFPLFCAFTLYFIIVMWGLIGCKSPGAMLDFIIFPLEMIFTFLTAKSEHYE